MSVNNLQRSTATIFPSNTQANNYRDFANIFLSEEKLENFLFQIRLFKPPQTNSNSKYQFLNSLAGKLKTEYSEISEAFRYAIDGDDYIAIPEENFNGREYEVWIDQQSYKLIPTSKCINLKIENFSDLTAIKNILAGNVRKKLTKSSEFWESAYRNKFYEIVPI